MNESLNKAANAISLKAKLIPKVTDFDQRSDLILCSQLFICSFETLYASNKINKKLTPKTFHFCNLFSHFCYAMQCIILTLVSK